MNHNPEKTAKSRKSPSAPMKLMNDLGILKGKKLDFGCGKGTDAEVFEMDKYDPHYFNVYPTKAYTTITCNYVLNVLPKEDERDVLKDIQGLLNKNGVAYITVRRDIRKEGLTSRKTFQRNVELNLPIFTEVKGRYCIYTITKGTEL